MKFVELQKAKKFTEVHHHHHLYTTYQLSLAYFTQSTLIRVHVLSWLGQFYKYMHIYITLNDQMCSFICIKTFYKVFLKHHTLMYCLWIILCGSLLHDWVANQNRIWRLHWKKVKACYNTNINTKGNFVRSYKGLCVQICVWACISLTSSGTWLLYLYCSIFWLHFCDHYYF